MQSTRVGVVGCGYWGPNLIRNLAALANCQVAAICDRDPARLASVADAYPHATTHTEAGGIIEDPGISAIVIATNVSSHYRLARQSLLAGKHVMVEKPLASSVAQCRELIQLADRVGRRLMVGHTFIHSAAVKAIKHMVDSGELGEIRYISAQRLNLGIVQQDVNVAWDLAPHDLSIILHLLGTMPHTVNCQGQSHVSADVEDVTNMSLGFPDNRLAMVHSSWLDPNKVRRMTIVGSRRMVVYDDNEPLEKLRVYDKRIDAPAHYDTFGEFQYAYHYGDMWAPYLRQYEPLRAQCENFLNAVRGGERLLTPAEDGLRVVEILEAASASLRRDGGPVPVTAPADVGLPRAHAETREHA